MTPNEQIDAKAETLHRRTTHLRNLIAVEAPDILIARELSLCAQGVADVALAMKAKCAKPLGMNIIASPTMPDNEMFVIPTRRPGESERDWNKRCVRLKNIGPDDAPALKIGPGGEYVTEYLKGENDD